MAPAVRAFQLDLKDALACGHKLKGKTVVVTGASSGFGKAFSIQAAQFGSRCHLGCQCPRREVRTEEIGSAGGMVATYAKPCDTSNWDDQPDMFEFSRETFGHVDVVIASAGVGEMSQFMKEEKLDASGHLKRPSILIIDVNLIGALFTIKIGYHHSKKNPAKEGKALLYIGSIYSANALPKGPLYASAKHAIYSLFKSIYSDCQEAGIATTIMAPWFVRTAIVTCTNAIALYGLPYASVSDVVAGMINSCADPTFHGNHVVVNPQGLLSFPFACPHLGPQGYIGKSYVRSTTETDRKTKLKDLLLIVRAMGANIVPKTKLGQLALAVALIALVRRGLRSGRAP